jgi:cytochrome c-type biogenesis protein CcmF
MFLCFMILLLVGGTVLILFRRRQLAPQRPIRSLLSRESLVLTTTYLLLVFTTVVVVGTLFVPLSALKTGRPIEIGPAFYNNALMPGGILLLTATSVVPLVRWGTRPRRREVMVLAFCLALAAAGVAIAAWCGLGHPLVLVVAGLGMLTVSTTLAGLLLDARRHDPVRTIRGVWMSLTIHRRQYAAYGIHLALACVATGISGSSLGSRQLDVQLDEGEVIQWAGRRIEYVQLVQREEADKLVAEVELRVSSGKGGSVTLMPARHFHLLQNQWTSEVAIHSTWAADFYTILHAGLGEGRVALTLIENPLMRWIWFGSCMAGAGVILAAWPDRRNLGSQHRDQPARPTVLTSVDPRERMAA